MNSLIHECESASQAPQIKPLDNDLRLGRNHGFKNRKTDSHYDKREEKKVQRRNRENRILVASFKRVDYNLK